MLTIGTIVLGPDVAIGSLEHPTMFHMVAGYLVFIVALAGMLGIGWCLNYDWDGLLQKFRHRHLLHRPGPVRRPNPRRNAVLKMNIDRSVPYSP